jgi:hypothetical protein
MKKSDTPRPVQAPPPYTVKPSVKAIKGSDRAAVSNFRSRELLRITSPANPSPPRLNYVPLGSGFSNGIPDRMLDIATNRRRALERLENSDSVNFGPQMADAAALRSTIRAAGSDGALLGNVNLTHPVRQKENSRGV